MKKYVDYSPMFDGLNYMIKRESKNAIRCIYFMILFSLISLATLCTAIYLKDFSIIVVSIFPIYFMIASFIFNKMHTKFKDGWIKMNEDNNKSWKEREDEVNIGWNEFFKRNRSNKYLSEEHIVASELDVIETSAKHIKELTERHMIK